MRLDRLARRDRLPRDLPRCCRADRRRPLEPRPAAPRTARRRPRRPGRPQGRVGAAAAREGRKTPADGDRPKTAGGRRVTPAATHTHDSSVRPGPLPFTTAGRATSTARAAHKHRDPVEGPHMANVAYQLSEEYAGIEVDHDPETGEKLDEPVRVGGFEGGTIGIPPLGETFDIAAALEEGDGLIVVNPDNAPQLVQQLDDYPALERTQAPPDAATVGYDQHTVQRLRQDAADRGIVGIGRLAKEDLVGVLQRHDLLVDAGDANAAEHAKDPDYTAGDTADTETSSQGGDS